jgi:serine/threonine protein kinase
LTPENIVLRNDGTIIIIDFGASNQFLGTMTGTIIGKQAYMAPEQLQGRTTLQSDIYAFGGTIQYLLTAKDPYPLSRSAPADFVSVSEKLNDIVKRCTCLNSEERFSSVTEIKSALHDLYMQSGIAKIYTNT